MIWSKHDVTNESWQQLGGKLSASEITMLGLWVDNGSVNLCTIDAENKIIIHSLPTTDNKYPALSPQHIPAVRFERAIADIYGIRATGAVDERPWLVHSGDYKFLPVTGDGVHQIPVGPIHAGIIEPGHFRFSANGETVVRLEERLGYVHKGIEKLFEGKDINNAARIAARISGDSTVAYSYAFALAAEQICSTEAPPRARYLRALMSEIERIANHLGDIGAICNDAAFAILHSNFGILREELLQLSLQCFGHRLMMDCIIPGGVSVDINGTHVKDILGWLDRAEKQFDRLIDVYDNTPSLKDRTNSTGILHHDLAKRFGAGGFVGRASGRNFDARRDVCYAPYGELDMTVTILHTGDVNSRLWVRRCEIKHSFNMIRQILNDMPDSDIKNNLTPASGEALTIVEGFRGDILLWLRLDNDGLVARCHPRDPSWLQWPLLEAAIEGNIVADFPLCNKSFNCSYSGHDL